MGTRRCAALALLLGALVWSPWPCAAMAGTDADARLQDLERQLERTGAELARQRKIAEEMQRAVGELRKEMDAMHACAVPAHADRAEPVVGTRMHENVQAEVASAVAPAQHAQEQLEARVAAPAWEDYARRFLGKFKLGALFYSDWAYYAKTGFGPAFLTQVNPPGPGNDGYNSFDVTRTYVNLWFTPNDTFTFRLTPNIYRTIGGSNQKFGKTAGIGTNLDGDLAFRLKYAYLDYNRPFAWVAPDAPVLSALREMKITFGQQPNPLIGWEEDLYGFRFVNLVPWNYTSLSSTQTGLSFHGPVKLHGLQYADYDVGVYTNASFSKREQTDTKSGKGRVSIYPFGARTRFDGLGLTVFYDYGFPNSTPDTNPETYVSRFAGLVHYTADTWGVAGEYDQGHNAFTSGNLFSGSGPADEFGLGPTEYADFDALVQGLQNNGWASQRGYAFFGHARIPWTPLTAFGMYQQFWPNTKVSLNPVDFRRLVVGVSYAYDEHLRFALDGQFLHYYHDQFAFPFEEAQEFGAKVQGDVPDSVPGDVEAIFLNLEFSY